MSPPHWLQTPVALAVGVMLHGTALQAQENPLRLQGSTQLQEGLPSTTLTPVPTFLLGDKVVGRIGFETTLQGDAELRRAGTVIKADLLEYDQSTDLAKAVGHVLINRMGNVYSGPLLELQVDAFEGFFDQPEYQFLQNEAHGTAKRVDFLDDQRAVIHDATYTTCKRLPGPSWMPDWMLRANTISLDTEDDVGVAEGAVLTFKGVPILPIPYISFPLSGQRKSGWMPPTPGLDTVNGVEYSQAYYWNIAPNRDATITPHIMSRRGVNLGTEFRYLEANYSGRLGLDVMPSDQLRHTSRWGLNFEHQGKIKSHWTTDGVAVDLNMHRVSDNDYWRDFNSNSNNLTDRLLSNDFKLSWNNGGFSNSVRMLKWQTLQNPDSPIVPPYDRLPQVKTHYSRTLANSLKFSMDADVTRFNADSALTGQPNADRAFSLLQLSRTWTRPAGYITPKVQLHASTYQFDAPLSTGQNAFGRAVPTFSLDSGLTFERETSFWGRNFHQTLEPRAFYVRTPFRDQSMLPNYDSGSNDFSMSTIFTENAFVGNDRISDANLLTLGLTTRLLDADTGAEVVRLGLAQRYQFENQQVALPGESPRKGRFSDVLLGGSVNWNAQWSVDATLQYNPTDEHMERTTFGAHYSPSNYRTIAFNHQYQRASSEQVALGWQWPIADLWGDKGQDLGPGRGQGEGRWYSVGRLNYSVSESQLVDTVLGFEYDAGCWLGRIVLDQKAIGTSSAKQSIMFQLEFVGFSRLGISPLQTLKDNITNYQYLRDQSDVRSRYSHYD